MGLALAELLLAEGLTVTLTHSSPKGLAAIAQRCPDLAQASPSLDLADLTSLDRLEPCLNCGVDYLVDLAQADHEGLLAAASEEGVRTYFESHVTNRLLLLKAVTRGMLYRGFGRLLHVSSAAAALPAPGQGFYAAAKRAAESCYLGLGLELGERGITSLSLRLGVVDAGRGGRFLDRQGLRKALAGKTLTVEQVASTLLFYFLTSPWPLRARP